MAQKRNQSSIGSSEDDDKREFAVSRKIMLAAIATLLGVVTIIVLLHLCSRYHLRRKERRQRAALHRQRTQITAINESSINEALKSGLDPLIIASLPMFTYKITPGQVDDHDEPTECSVCLGTITEEFTDRVLLNCKHMFHVECIDTWLGSHTTCPIYSSLVEPRVQASEDKLKSCASGFNPRLLL
ncbi:RING-H2 finger protein ATL2 [Gossypium arboreum]|nr:RING-H2 finger protein ATL2 [Gossypium arboreum]